MSTIQDLMNDRILKEIEDLKEVQAQLQRVITALADLVLEMTDKESHEKDT